MQEESKRMDGVHHDRAYPALSRGKLAENL